MLVQVPEQPRMLMLRELYMNVITVRYKRLITVIHLARMGWTWALSFMEYGAEGREQRKALQQYIHPTAS
jgi:hypothetical protein